METFSNHIARDHCTTPSAAVDPLLPFLTRGDGFIDPCAGKEMLVQYLVKHGIECIRASDIEPTDRFMPRDDARFTDQFGADNEYFIAHPPWTPDILDRIIWNLSSQFPTWLLLDAGWMHTQQATRFRRRLRMVVSVGPVEWDIGSGLTLRDNCAWYLFSQPMPLNTVYVGRVTE